MPVTLQHVDHAAWDSDSQLQIDLRRIYADAPAERLPAPLDDFIYNHLADGHFFCCARFNDRLLGAVAVVKDAQAWWLSYFCVRETTRRRGVGSRLLSLTSASAHQEGYRLRVASRQLLMADQLLLNRLGYRLTQAGDYFELVFLPKGVGPQ